MPLCIHSPIYSPYDRVLVIKRWPLAPGSPPPPHAGLAPWHQLHPPHRRSPSRPAEDPSRRCGKVDLFSLSAASCADERWHLCIGSVAQRACQNVPTTSDLLHACVRLDPSRLITIKTDVTVSVTVGVGAVGGSAANRDFVLKDQRRIRSGLHHPPWRYCPYQPVYTIQPRNYPT